MALNRASLLDSLRFTAWFDVAFDSLIIFIFCLGTYICGRSLLHDALHPDMTFICILLFIFLVAMIPQGVSIGMAGSLLNATSGSTDVDEPLLRAKLMRVRSYHIFLATFNLILACLFVSFVVIIPSPVFFVLGGSVFVCNLIHIPFVYIIRKFSQHSLKIHEAASAMVMAQMAEESINTSTTTTAI